MNSLKIVTTSIYKIPPNLPLPKGGITHLRSRGVKGRFSNAYVNSILRLLISLHLEVSFVRMAAQAPKK
jgi:hypothetical protein